jgi:hypothetical protein
MGWNLSTSRARIHGVGALLFLWLAAAPGPRQACGIPAAPPGPPGRAAAADTASRAERSSPPSPADVCCVFRVPEVPKPAYLAPMTDPVFGTGIERITNDPGRPTSPILGRWGWDARHVYSTQQPWNSDGTLLVIENREGGSPTPIILDGATYAPRLAPCPQYDFYDFRWHPAPDHPHQQINVPASGTELMWFDVVECVRTRSWTLPMRVDYGIGSGYGNPSDDGRFVALGGDSAMFMVGMDPRPPFAPYPAERIGPVYVFPPCRVALGDSADCAVRGLSISPSGRYVDVKYGTENDTTADLHRIYDVDPATLALSPHPMAPQSPRCGSFAARTDGWIFPLKHSDMALDPFDGSEDVIVGGRSCPGSGIGRVVKVRLSDGLVTALTDPEHEAPISHVSTRNLDRPGWAFVSYFKVDSARFSDEIVAVPLDGSRTTRRIAHAHSLAEGCYRCESHPVPSRDGSRLLFASNWARDCAHRERRGDHRALSRRGASGNAAPTHPRDRARAGGTHATRGRGERPRPLVRERPKLRHDQHGSGQDPRPLAQAQPVVAGPQRLAVPDAHHVQTRAEAADFALGHAPPAHVEEREGSG